MWNGNMPGLKGEDKTPLLLAAARVQYGIPKGYVLPPRLTPSQQVAERPEGGERGIGMADVGMHGG